MPLEFKTGSIELKTLAPKCVSPTCAIVAAETNIADIEPFVGFQWKKYDAPASLNPSEGYGAVCDGVLEGYIKNLQSTSYYNVRPFYKDKDDKYYYGEWVTFDPSDFSYFEPTVRTFPVEDVSDNSARVRGYALAGTDDILSQGFQYWPATGSQKMPAYAPVSDQIITVPVSGQVMTATFTDLQPATTYVYRAFVETESGFTYGDEESFTTEEVAGIYSVETEPQEVTIVAYYDIMGHRHNEPVIGFNIALYSNGTTKKLLFRN